MADELGDMVPYLITGEAVFTSYDGLRAEGNGALGFLTFDQKPLEMRSDQVFAALLPAASEDNAMFLQSIDLQGGRQWLIGLVRKITDFNKRPGIIGACISLTERNGDLVGFCTHLRDHLFPLIEDATIERWHGKPLPERLNLLSDVPAREVPIDYRIKAGTELLHRVNDAEISQSDVIETGFDLLDVSGNVGRVLILPEPTRGTKPVDRRFMASVQAVVNEGRERVELARERSLSAHHNSGLVPQSVEQVVRNLMAQENRTGVAERDAKVTLKSGNGLPLESRGQPKNMEEVLRRQEIIANRLARIEKKLKLGRPQQNAAALPIDAAFVGKRAKPDRLNRIILTIGSGLFCILIVLLLVWFFLREGRDVQIVQMLEDSVPVSMTGSGISTDSPTEEALTDVDCSNPQDITQDTFCKKQED